MRSRAVRITLTLLAFGAIIAAAYLTWSVEHRLSTEQLANASFDQLHASALRDAYELKAAQQAYVAAGQDEAFWIGKAGASIAALREALASLTAASQNGAVHAAIAASLDSLGDFEQVDKRARGYAASGQKLLASDIIFSDGLDASGKLLTTLQDVRRIAGQNTAEAARTARLEWMMALGASAGVVAIALALLTGLPASEPTAASTVSAEAPRLDLRLKPEVPQSPVRNATVDARPSAAATPANRQPAAPPAIRETDLLGLASICSDLARLSDTGSLPSILERAAKALDATGLVLWVVDPDGKELMPVAAHGYPVSVLSRLGSLSVHAENATAAAFRTGLLQTVKGDTDTEGAIAAPLVGSSGSRGVMSAEVRHHGERQPARLATASIVAAQLATLIGPPAARTQERSSAAL